MWEHLDNLPDALKDSSSVSGYSGKKEEIVCVLKYQLVDGEYIRIGGYVPENICSFFRFFDRLVGANQSNIVAEQIEPLLESLTVSDHYLFVNFLQVCEKRIPYLKKHYPWHNKDTGDFLKKVAMQILYTVLENKVSEYQLDKTVQTEIVDSCISAFPAAAKKNYHLFNNKNFMRQVQGAFLQEQMSQISMMFSWDEEYVWFPMKKIRDIYFRFMTTYDQLYQSYLRAAVTQAFENDHLKKLSQQQQNLRAKTMPSFPQEGISQTLPVPVSIVEQLSEHDSLLIDQLIATFPLQQGKLKKDMKRSLAKMLIHKKACRVRVFLEKYQLAELPPSAEPFFDLLWIQLFYESSQENKQTSHERLNNEEQCIDDLLMEQKKEYGESAFQVLSDQEPFSFLLWVLDQYGYSVPQPQKLEKQFKGMLRNQQVKIAFLNALQERFFSNPIKKIGVDAYSLEVGFTWWRFILFKKGSGFEVDGLFSHDDYEKRLKNIS